MRIPVHGDNCSFIHIDCDVYSSTYTVLDELAKNNRLANGTVILFDEFYSYEKYKEHEYKALLEVAGKYDVEYEWIAHTTGGQAAIKIAA